MKNVRSIKRKQVVSDDIIKTLETVVEDLKSGVITDFVLVADDPVNGAFYRVSDFTNAWKLLGAIAYAQQSVLDGLGKK